MYLIIAYQYLTKDSVCFDVNLGSGQIKRFINLTVFPWNKVT